MNNFIWELRFEIKLPKKTTIIVIKLLSIINTPSPRDFVVRSSVSTGCKNTVVKRKAKTNIPIMDAKKGKIFQTNPAAIISKKSL